MSTLELVIAPRVSSLAIVFLLTLTACGDDDEAAASTTQVAAEAPPSPAVERGRALVLRFQCNRCHTIEGIDAPAATQDCVGCHRSIQAGTFAATPEDLARWTRNIRGLVDSPSLRAVGRRFRSEWLRDYLLNPHDLRPYLQATMPRLDMSEEEAADIAAFLTRDREGEGEAPSRNDALIARGRQLFGERGCTACHEFADAALPERMIDEDELTTRLAPNLAITRRRFIPGRLAAWIAHPREVKDDTAMPDVALTTDEAQALASYVLYAELRPAPRREVPEMLPLLTRPVFFAEVDERVFHRICRHCHADADLALGDGGPGNDGGFGFEGRGLNLTNYEGMSAGVLVEGRRESIFAVDESGMPRLVHALRARQLEEASERDTIRGMPLAHPALSPEEIQLVASWIAQGRRRE